MAYDLFTRLILRHRFIIPVILLVAIITLCGGLYIRDTQPYKTYDLHYSAPDLSGRQLRLRLLLPHNVSSPFPLAIINHGSPATKEGREELSDLRFTVLAEWLTQRGFAVAMPLRRGYGKNAGTWDEHYVSCDTPHYFEAGLETAKDILAAKKFLELRSDIMTDKIILIGQSAGGWGSLAVAGQNPNGIAGIVNFAGGRGGNVENRLLKNCNASELIWAAGQYGKSATIPSLWLYAENDRFFPPELATHMFTAYQSHGKDNATLVITPPIGDDGHRLAIDKEGQAEWEAPLEQFLHKLQIISPRKQP